MSPFIVTFTAALAPLFVLVDPIAAIPVFIGLTRDRSRTEALAIARRASVAGAVILIAAAYGGPALFSALQLDPAAFRAAGGGLLLLLAVDMLKNAPKRCECGPEELAGHGKDVAIVPLAMPILAGPGSIAAVIMLAGDASGAAGMAGLTAAILLVFGATALCLRFAVAVKAVLGPSGLAIIERLMGMILAALAVQLIVRGIQSLLA